MNLQELRTFLAIVETGSLIRASTQLNVTQSTVTARLQSLEDGIGQRLINRNRSGATLTAAGINFLRYADTISNLWRQAKQEISLPQGMSGICNLACEFDLWPGLGEPIFNALQASQPQMAISVWLGAQSEVAKWLDEGKSDLALNYIPSTSERQDHSALKPDLLQLYSTDPDAPTRFNPNYVFVEGGSAFGRDHAAAYADAGTAKLSFGNARLGLDHLLQHGGSAYLPLRLANAHVQAGALFLIEGTPIFERTIYINHNTTARAEWDWFDELVEPFRK